MSHYERSYLNKMRDSVSQVKFTGSEHWCYDMLEHYEVYAILKDEAQALITS